METLESVKNYFEENKSLLTTANITSVKLLSGGLVNYVYRIIFDDNTSVILKYFPAFLKVNNSIPMSQKRYFVEKAALEVFGLQPWLIKNPTSKIRTPKLIHANDEKFILIMEDAGVNSETLFNSLIVGSNLYSNFIELIPREIKIFLNYLTEEANILLKNNEVFKNESTLLILESYFPRIWSNMVAKLEIEELKLIPNLSIEAQNDPNSVLVFGDLWPSSILIDKEKDLVWIIDWEMTRFGTKTRDLEQLMANLWIMKQSPIFDQVKIENLIKIFQKEFFGDEHLDWRKQCGALGTTNFIHWVVCLLNETHWGLDNLRDVAIKALTEIR